MHKLSLPLVAMLALSSLAGCSGEKGDPGAPGTRGSDGTNGMDGQNGMDGTDGEDGEDGMMGLPGPGSAGEGVTEIALFGEFFFPEGVAAAPDGTLYVGSLGTGEIVRVPAGTFKSEAFIGAGTDTYGTVGMIVDAGSDTLWTCAIDLNFTLPSQLKAFNLTTGQETASHDYPLGGACNDIAIDAQGNIYATDSFLGAIRRLPAGGDTLEEWVTDPIFTVPAGEFGLNGIVWDGAELWAVNLFDGSLYHLAIEADGSAGAVTNITLDPPLVGPDGIKARGPGSFIVVDNGAFSVKEITVTGTAGTVTTLRNGMDVPTTGDFAYGDMWVAEGQFDHLFGADPNPPDLPFKVKRVVMP